MGDDLRWILIVFTSKMFQDELEASKDEAAREAKRVQLFQAEMELVQSAEQRLKEETAALRERNVQLELERSEVARKLDVHVEEHEAYVQRMESKFRVVAVNPVPRTASDVTLNSPKKNERVQHRTRPLTKNNLTTTEAACPPRAEPDSPKRDCF